MRRLPLFVSLMVLAVFGRSPQLGAQDLPLSITTSALPSATAGIRYQAPLQASGGIAPYSWQLSTGGKLPPGIRLHPHSGRLTGTPTKPGEYHFTIVLSDVNAPPGQVERAFTLTVVAGLTVDWKRAPAVSGTWIAGSLLVSNHTDAAANLTVIVVAVNQIGRATALAYQRFTIQPQAQQEIPFGASPGPGTYMVRADAVATFSSAKVTLRAHKQTGDEGALVIEEI